MPLRCFLFSSDEGTVAIVRQILSGLGVDGEVCANAVTAAEKITNENFQIVIIDWDQQPEAGVLLNTARERKAAERPLTLAIVSDDASGPHALHAGANSLLRKPIVASQAKETLTTARDLLHAKQGVPATAPAIAAAAAACASNASPTPVEPPETKPTRPPGLLQPSGARPSTLFEAEIKAPRQKEDPTPPPVEAKAEEKTEPAVEDKDEHDEPSSSEVPSRGLQWYLKTRAGGSASAAASSAPAPAPETPATQSKGNPDLIGFEPTAYLPKPAATPEPVKEPIIAAKPDIPRPPKRESRKEPELFSSFQDKREHAEPALPTSSSGFKKRTIVGALILAAIAMVVAPQAPWHSKLQALWRNGRQSVHAWLYPQPATPTAAPDAHENFTRAGDEYKLPVAETIPDATTDPSQIQVVPVVDPTAKKPTDPSAADKPVGLPADGLTPADTPPQSPGTRVPEPQTAQPAPVVVEPAAPAPTPARPAPTVVAPPPAVARSESAVVASSSASNPPAPRQPQPRAPTMPSNIPQSLRSQMASTTPDSSGNKAPETALPSIEPVTVSEIQERALLTQQQVPQYPATAKGQQGTITLQVVIGRDGTVQDAKFLQGSLVFARAAIDSVTQWKFKPYLMNTRPVSVQTTLTLKFKPGQ